MIRRLLASLFAAPSVGAAPAADFPIPELAPAPDTAAYHQRRAHRAGTAAHLAYGRWMVGHDCVSPTEIAELAAQAAADWAMFAILFQEDAAGADVPDTPGDLLGGEG